MLISLDCPIAGRSDESWWSALDRVLGSGTVHITGAVNHWFVRLAWLVSHNRRPKGLFGVPWYNWMAGPSLVTQYDQIITCDQTPKNAYNTEDVPSPPVVYQRKRCYHPSMPQHMVCNEYQNDWDAHLSHVEYVYNNSASAATGLASNEVHIGRLTRPHLAVFDSFYGGARQDLDRDYLAYCDPARERQRRAYELVREQHPLTAARVNGRNSTLSDARFYDMGDWTDPPSVLHPTVSTAACQRSRARDRLHQRWTSPRGNLLTSHWRCLSCPLPIRSATYWSLLSGTTPLMVSGDLVKPINHPTSSDTTSYGSSTTQAPPWSNSQNQPTTRRSTPLVAPDISKLTDAPTPFKASNTANPPPSPFACSPHPFSCLLRTAMSISKIAMSTSRIVMSTPRIAISTPRIAMPTPRIALSITRIAMSTPLSRIVLFP